MKKLLLLVAFLGFTALGASAQYVRIVNNTGCTITMKLRASNMGMCPYSYSSPYVSIGPSSFISAPLPSFYSGTIPPPTAWLSQVDFFNFSCGSGAAIVGYAACSLPTTAGLAMGTCCPPVTATYTSSGTPGAAGSVQGVFFN